MNKVTKQNALNLIAELIACAQASDENENKTRFERGLCLLPGDSFMVFNLKVLEKLIQGETEDLEISSEAAQIIKDIEHSDTEFNDNQANFFLNEDVEEIKEASVDEIFEDLIKQTFATYGQYYRVAQVDSGRYMFINSATFNRLNEVIFEKPNTLKELKAIFREDFKIDTSRENIREYIYRKWKVE